MQRTEVTWKHAIIVWWSLMWRVTLYGSLAGGLAGFVIGIVLGVVGKGDSAEFSGQIAGFLAGIPVGIWVVKTILTKEFGRFRIAILPSTEAQLEKIVQERNV
ncbi:MAG: hypothetical protein D6698_02835 [Gammaproteobacteria bacterium]|nr:MAG: hypothetical protein D6698_02835 [Gammaproteobacteria bacterium]